MEIETLWTVRSKVADGGTHCHGMMNLREIQIVFGLGNELMGAFERVGFGENLNYELDRPTRGFPDNPHVTMIFTKEGIARILKSSFSKSTLTGH